MLLISVRSSSYTTGCIIGLAKGDDKNTIGKLFWFFFHPSRSAEITSSRCDFYIDYGLNLTFC